MAASRSAGGSVLPIFKMPDIFDPSRLIFLHGLEGTSRGAKATLLRGLFPGMVIPDFSGPLEERMAALKPILGHQDVWTIVGSSFGGLMAALFACLHPAQVRKLVLLAPALILPQFASSNLTPVDVPTIIYHGRQDQIIPVEPTRRLAHQVFRNLTFTSVDDDHGLHKTVMEIDWPVLLAD
jgi:pimeloyl-ACP methyl ester carboxylesterase